MALDLKKLIKIFIILICLIVILAIVLSIKNKKEEQTLREQYELELEDTIKKVSNGAISNKLKKNIEKFIYYLNNEEYNAVYSLLDKDFTNKYKINEENIYKYLECPKEDFNIKSVYELEVSSDFITYFVYYTSSQKEYSIIINYDYSNNTYSICPFGYMYEDSIKYDAQNVPELLNIEQIRKEKREIQNNSYNII